MKKILFLFALSLVACSSPEEVTKETLIRVLNEKLTNKGTEEYNPIMYFEGRPFTGVGFDVYDNGQLYEETNYKDGKLDGLAKRWYDNGLIQYEWNFKDNFYDGLSKEWYKNNQLRYETNYKDGLKDGLSKHWHDNGLLDYTWHYKNGKRIN